MHDIMILAQAVLQSFRSQGFFTIQNAIVGKERILPNIYRMSDTIHMPNIMILAQAVLQILSTKFHRFTMQKSKKGHNSAMTSPMKKKNWSAYFSCFPYIKFQDPISNRS